MSERECASSRNHQSQSRDAQAPQPPAPQSQTPFVHELKADDYLLSPPDVTARPQLTEIPELIGMMLKAIERHGSIPDLPNKEVVADWFKGQPLSTGWVIDPHLAEGMATCCRSAIRLKGGRRRQTAAVESVALPVPECSPGTLDFAKPPLREIPELIGMMLAEIKRHGGVPVLPRKTVAGWFIGRTLSNGWVIGEHLANSMATCCRSVLLMEGGNRWQKANR
jgi:hypothetical protein